MHQYGACAGKDERAYAHPLRVGDVLFVMVPHVGGSSFAKALHFSLASANIGSSCFLSFDCLVTSAPTMTWDATPTAACAL